MRTGTLSHHWSLAPSRFHHRSSHRRHAQGRHSTHWMTTDSQQEPEAQPAAVGWQRRGAAGSHSSQCCPRAQARTGQTACVAVGRAAVGPSSLTVERILIRRTTARIVPTYSSVASSVDREARPAPDPAPARAMCMPVPPGRLTSALHCCFYEYCTARRTRSAQVVTRRLNRARTF